MAFDSHQIAGRDDDESTHRSPSPHDSLVTVRLSEPLQMSQSDIVTAIPETKDRVSLTEDTRGAPQQELDTIRRPLSIMTKNLSTSSVDEPTPTIDAKDERQELAIDSRRNSDSTHSSSGSQVDWDELERTEDLQPRDQDSEDSTALLLARLEQENNALVTNPKSGLTKVTSAETDQKQRRSRPPSMQQLKKMVNGPTPSSLRYSLVSAPPMTDLEFYAALVQDYKRTAQRLPTLLAKKIRSGIPPPIRGVVWQSMSGARDQLLEEEFDRLCNESSPYEGIIGKDLGRSFPGVEMFRDPEGEGQKMLGRVLKCFSLYDHKIGYCQGLGFLVGPLLMHMGDKQAFCILVRLMEHYGLRSCFLPDLSGLHVRIYQFKELLRKHCPELNTHLEFLQIEPAYVSQWFLSFFAVTCPLPMLFRIYDVIFAEGASETIMRVALAVMRKNEAKILACTEFEDVMQLLLSRGLWDCYNYNADSFVEDFVSLTSDVTQDNLKSLEQSYQESHNSDVNVSSYLDIGSTATRFLGRLWSASSLVKATTLSPAAPSGSSSRPASTLRRSPSKQSMASTLFSAEGATDSITSSAFTDATTVSRDSSSVDGSSLRCHSATFSQGLATTKSTKINDKDLHSQIEDLLIALSELQRDNDLLATQLQSEREEREEDHGAVRSLLGSIKSKHDIPDATDSVHSVSTVSLADESIASCDIRRESTQEAHAEAETDDFSYILDVVQKRVAKDKPPNRRSSQLYTRSQLREELVRSKEQYMNEVGKSADLSRRLDDLEQELVGTREQLKESHAHSRTTHQEKQRLEKQLQELRAKKTPALTPEGSNATESEWPRLRQPSVHGGLRELKLGRQSSTRATSATFAKRSSSLQVLTPNAPDSATKEAEMSGLSTSYISTSDTLPAISVRPQSPAVPRSPVVDTDALIIELVQAKTAEAVAKQEAEEAKAKLEGLRKMLSGGGVSPGIATESSGHRSSPSQPNLLNGSSLSISKTPEVKISSDLLASGANVPAPTGGFWSGWGKRNVSGAGLEKA